jgi:hypothetical protein
MKELKAERGKGRLEVEVKADRNGRQKQPGKREGIRGR